MSDYEIRLDQGMWKHLDKVLSQLPTTVVNQVVGPASRRSMKPVLSKAKSLVPRRTGLLRKSLGTVQRTNRRRGTVYTIVGPRSGFKDAETGENPVNIAHLVEYGTKAHLIAPKGQSGVLQIKRGTGPTVLVEGAVHHPGATAQPFMRPAYDAEGRGVLAAMERELTAGIMKKVAKWECKPK